jgi:DNA repair ATPase RecN
LAGTHFRIEKTVEGENAVAKVEQVEGEKLVAEIVRMLGGEDEKGAVGKHARELLEAA